MNSGHARAHNYQLRKLLDEANWTGDALAREVNTVGAEAGLSLHYSRSSVSHWLSGMQPREPVPQFVAEAFTRRLGCRVPVTETGLARPVSEDEDRSPAGDVVSQLAELAAATARPDLFSGCVYSVAKLSVPDWARLSARIPQSRRPGGEAGRVGQAEVKAATLMCDLFSAADAAWGGRHGRSALGAYLGTTIAPWLRADTSPAVRRQLLITAARLCYLYGFMCFDEKLHGLAQRHYLISAHLAAEAGDATSFAITLRALSVQARYLGYHRQAINLAESAVRTAATRHFPAKTLAFLYGQLAVAHAAVGSHAAALSHLSTAEHQLEHADRNTEAVGAFHAGSLAHQHAAVSAYLGDRVAAISNLQTSLRHRPANERRSRAIVLARLAELQFQGGSLEAACETWLRFLDDHRQIQSARADSALATMHEFVLPYQRNSSVRHLRHAAASMLSLAR